MVLVVGGQSRKVGKTSVMASIIRASSSAGWVAVKVTPHHAHSGWSLEREDSIAGDSGRYLAAGASEAWYLRCEPGALAEAIPALRTLLGRCAHVIIESNSVVEFIAPDLCLLVVDPAVTDRKRSFEDTLARADALVIVDSPQTRHPRLPCFHVSRPDFASRELDEFVRARLAHAAGKTISMVNRSSSD